MTLIDTDCRSQISAEISVRLKKGEIAEAKKVATEIVVQPEDLHQWLPELERLFHKSGCLESLIELLWENRNSALTDMYVVGHFMYFCNRIGVYEQFAGPFRSWIASDSCPDFTFSEKGHFRHFRNLTDEQRRDFADAKYRRWKDFAAQDFFEAIDQFSVFATVSQPVSRFLFEHRADKGVPFSPWFAALRSSELFKHVVADANTIYALNRKGGAPDKLRYPRPPKLAALVDVDHAKSRFAELDLCTGLLLCTIHDAHLTLAKKCSVVCVPERYLISTKKGRNRILVGKDSNAHASAFQAVKVLRSKKMLLMVADGGARRSKQTSQASILGRSVAFADGAPTIAYESGCATGWYTVAREGTRFVPVVVPGPSREPKESFKDYKDRWWNFYAGQVEKLFTGDPRNITLWYFWPKLFRSATSVAPFRDNDDDSDYDESEDL